MGFFDIIPYFGPLIGMVAIILFTMLQNVHLTIPVAIVIFILQQVEAMFFMPRIVGNKTGLHPGIVLLALVAGGAVAGPVGMLAAVPIYLILSILTKEIYLLHVRYRKTFETESQISYDKRQI